MNSTNKIIDRVHSYAYQKKVFTKEECEKIISLTKNTNLSEGQIVNKNNLPDIKLPDIRTSKICWINCDEETKWIFSKMINCVFNLNSKYFQFNISGMYEGLQFTNYKSPNGKYAKHIDRVLDRPVRKLSVSIQLTDPNNYEGGELYVYDNNKGTVMEKEQGDLVMFPSYMLHEVKPVTKGERNSLVAWITGEQFK